MNASLQFMGSEIRFESNDAYALKNFLFRVSTICNFAFLSCTKDSDFDLSEDACDLRDWFHAAYLETVCEK